MIRIFKRLGIAFILALFAGFLALWIVLPSGDELARLAQERPVASLFLDRNGLPLDVAYEEEHQAGVFIPLDSLPSYFLDDLKFFEDASFDWNPGVSLKGLARAVFRRARGDRRAGGGSTLTMQLARILSGEKENTIARKLMEIGAAIKITSHLSKAQILELYVNQATWAPGPHSGIQFAAHRLFGKGSASNLMRSEGIMLMSFLPNPSRATSEYVRTREYMNRLERLYAAGRISASEYVSMLDVPQFAYGYAEASSYAVFLDRVAEECRGLLSGSGWSLRDGLVIETTLDSAVNDAAYAFIARGVQTIGGKAAMVLLDRENEARAYLTVARADDDGSYRGDFDLVSASGVQPASRFKIVIYALFIEDLVERGLTSTEILEYKLPTTCKVGDYVTVDSGEPHEVSLQEAIARSLNGPACWVANHHLGLDRLAEFAERLGIDIPLYPSVALGTEGVSELTMASVYSALIVRNGYLKLPVLIRRISTSNRTLYDADDYRAVDEQQVVSARTSRILRQTLRGVVREGTASRLLNTAPGLLTYDLTAKTGTARRQRGLTGSIGATTYSLMIEGPGLGSASNTAVLLGAVVLEQLVDLDGELNPGTHRSRQ